MIYSPTETEFAPNSPAMSPTVVAAMPESVKRYETLITFLDVLRKHSPSAATALERNPMFWADPEKYINVDLATLTDGVDASKRQ
eukprot:4067654-Pyramimonas_sp.AAC.1